MKRDPGGISVVDHFLFNDDPRRDLAPATPLLFLCRFRRLGAFVHAARFNIGATLQAFQTGDFFAQFGDGLLQGGDFTEQFNQQSLKLWTAQRGKGGWRRHMMQRVHGGESAQEKNAAVPGLLPLLPPWIPMPYKFNESRRHKIPRARYRVTNWPEYDAALVQRGSITVWFTEEAVAAWHAPATGARGGQPIYSAIAIETGLALRLVFHQPLRQTEGLLRSIAEVLGYRHCHTGSYDAQPTRRRPDDLAETH